MAVNFAEMPVLDGFRGCYDYTNYNGNGAWGNQYGNGADFTLYDSQIGANCVFFPQGKGRGYIPENIGNNFTFYAIVKTDTATHFDGACWGIAMCGANASYRVFAGFMTQTNKYALGNGDEWPFANATGSEWHCIAVSVNNGQQTLYVDGNAVLTTNLARNYEIKGFYINTGAYNGAVPVVDDYSLNMYVKYIGYATDNHSAMQIKRNSDWLFVQYDFKAAPLDSETSGADAAAIAWCLAKNIEQSSGLEMQKKAYKEGLKKGIEGGADITEEYEQGNTNLDITTDEDGNISSPFIGRFVDGIYYTDPTGAHVHMWLDLSWTDTLSDGTIKTGRMVYDAYDATGTLIDTVYSIGSGGWAWKMSTYDTHVVQVIIQGSKVTCYHEQTIPGYPTGRYRHDWSPYGFEGNSIMANAIKVGNIPPEIIS